MTDKTTKTVKVPSSKAEEWDQYVEKNPVVDSVSHLIRLSVEREMQGLYDEPQTLSDDTDDAASGEVLTAVKQIQTGMSDLEERMSAIERVGEAEANYDIRKAVFSILPEPPEGKVVEVPEPGKGKGSAKQSIHGYPPDFAMTSSDVATKLGANTEDAREALSILEETTGQVESVEDQSENRTYYWKKGQ